MATWPMVQVRYNYTSVRSLRDLHSLGPSALGCVNSVETCTSVYNLYLHINYVQPFTHPHTHTYLTHVLAHKHSTHTLHKHS